MLYMEPYLGTRHEAKRMGDADGTPERDGRPVADAVRGNWVDRLAPAATRPYLRLSRADRPIGTWLLLLPCWWGVMLAAAADPAGLNLFDLWIVLGCAIGAFLMRGAGCTWNDMTDRDFDAAVARTKSRPIPSGQVTAQQAFAWLVIQSLLAFCILLTLQHLNAILPWCILSLLPVAIYPFRKTLHLVAAGLPRDRVQLGGAPGLDGVIPAALGWPAVLLYLGGIAWTLFYDTIYAHQDTEDDALIGDQVDGPAVRARTRGPGYAASGGDDHTDRAWRHHGAAARRRHPGAGGGACGCLGDGLAHGLAARAARHRRRRALHDAVSVQSRHRAPACAVFCRRGNSLSRVCD
jgi:4-hydroxybenzoate polyprenyl transferase